MFNIIVEKIKSFVPSSFNIDRFIMTHPVAVLIAAVAFFIAFMFVWSAGIGLVAAITHIPSLILFIAAIALTFNINIETDEGIQHIGIFESGSKGQKIANISCVIVPLVLGVGFYVVLITLSIIHFFS